MSPLMLSWKRHKQKEQAILPSGLPVFLFVCFKIEIKSFSRCSWFFRSYLRLDVLLRCRDQTGTAQPQHHHDGQEEARCQDPAREA